MTTRQLWTSLSETKKREVALAVAQAHQPGGLPPGMVQLVAGIIGFRAASVRRSSVEQTAGYLYRAMPALPHDAAVTLLVKYHTDTRAELLSDVYDALGVKHEGAEVEDAILDSALDTDAAQLGVAALVGKHAVADLLFCFSVMELACSPAWRPTVTAVKASLEAQPPPV